MTPLQKLKKLLQTAEGRTTFIDEQLAKLEKVVDSMGELLNKKIVEEFLNELDVEGGEIKPTAQNMRKMALIEKIYQVFTEQQTYKIVTRMIDDVYAFTGMHLDYANELSGSKLDGKAIESVITARLGLNDKGELRKDGFMKGLLDDPTVKNEIIRFTNDKVISGTGYEDLRKSFRTLIVGDDERLGNFKSFYRGVAYDTYTRIDALNGKLWADKLKLDYFIYAGTRRKASRHFCIDRKGKVFSKAEAMEWYKLIGKYAERDGKKVNIGPMVAKEDIPTYNPFVDRGGYGCVDDIMWISYEIAVAKRPDLKKS